MMVVETRTKRALGDENTRLDFAGGVEIWEGPISSSSTLCKRSRLRCEPGASSSPSAAAAPAAAPAAGESPSKHEWVWGGAGAAPLSAPLIFGGSSLVSSSGMSPPLSPPSFSSSSSSPRSSAAAHAARPTTTSPHPCTHFTTHLALQCYRDVSEALLSFPPPHHVLATLFPYPNTTTTATTTSASSSQVLARAQHCQTVVGMHCEDVRVCLRRDDLLTAFECIQAITVGLLDALRAHPDSLFQVANEALLHPLACTWTALLRAFKLSRQLGKYDFPSARAHLEALNQFLLHQHVVELDVAVEYMSKLLGDGCSSACGSPRLSATVVAGSLSATAHLVPLSSSSPSISLLPSAHASMHTDVAMSCWDSEAALVDVGGALSPAMAM